MRVAQLVGCVKVIYRLVVYFSTPWSHHYLFLFQVLHNLNGSFVGMWR